MKLKNSMQILIIIIFIFLYHYYIQKGFEKSFSDTFFSFEQIKRPLEICKNELHKNINCIGMSSGHAESFTILSLLLYYYDFIPLSLAILIIFIVSLQRFFTSMHTIFQIVVGITLGLIYTLIYVKGELSIYSFATVFFIGFILVLSIIYELNNKIHQPIPLWVDKSMYQSIENKQNSSLYMKILSIYSNSIMQDRLFLSWSDLERYLDIIIERIKASGIQYDGVVGIKTGGAIISDYVSKKLNLPNYKVKLSRSEYNCNKQSYHTINDIYQKQIMRFYGEYNICEEINENLEGQNIILLDELVSTGITMNETMNYLKNKKHVRYIYPACVSFSKKMFKMDFHVDYVFPSHIMVWPWGYDN